LVGGRLGFPEPAEKQVANPRQTATSGIGWLECRFQRCAGSSV
jgi:hypothetical protein